MMRTHTRILVASIFAMSVYHGLVLSRPAEGWRKKHDATGTVVAINPLNPNTVYAGINNGGRVDLIVSHDRGQTWGSPLSPGLAAIGQILVHPSDTLTIFCAGSSNLRKTTDGGLTWRTVLPGYTIDGESIVIDPLHPDTMHAAEITEGKVYRSLDRGEHWLDSALSVNNVSTLSIRPDNPSILYAGTGLGSISKSSNGGKTWRVVRHPVTPGSVQTEKISISPSSPLVAYVAFNGNVDTAVGVWKTTNGGELWLKTGTPPTSFMGIDIDPLDANIVYAGTSDASGPRIYRSTDGGVLWTPLSIGLPALGSVSMVKIHPLDPSVKWAAASDAVTGGGGVFRHGVTSTMISGAVLHASTADSVMNGFVVTSPMKDSLNLAATRGRFAFYYFDGDPSATLDVTVQAYPFYRFTQELTFVQDQEKNENLSLQELAKYSITGTVFDSATGGPRRVLLRLRGTTSIGPMTLTGSSDTAGAFQFDSLYVSYPPIIRYSDLAVEPDLPYSRERIMPIVVDSDGVSLSIPLRRADVLVVGAADSGKYAAYYGTALESLKVGYNIWDEKSRGPAPMSAAASLRKKMLVFYTGSFHDPLPRNDIDSLMAALDAGCSLFLTGQDIAEKNDTTLLMQEYLRTGFQANTLIAYVTGTPGDIFNTLGFNTVNLGASNQTSRDRLKPLDARVKTVIGYGYGNLGIASVRIDSVGSGGRAIVMGFGFEAISGVEERIKVMRNAIGYLDGSIVVGVDAAQPGTTLPSGIQLAQNYPNPFNPSTKISFTIADAGDVDLSVFDVTGRLVETLIRGRRNAGTHSVAWEGAGYSSGVYVYRLTVTPVHQPTHPLAMTKMMILMK